MLNGRLLLITAGILAVSFFCGINEEFIKSSPLKNKVEYSRLTGLLPQGIALDKDPLRARKTELLPKIRTRH
jgi:hypothetical protein